MTAPKLTPAMIEWCRAIADLTGCRLVRTTRLDAPTWKHYRTEGINRKQPKPTWAMVDRIVEAGLIGWAFRGTNRGTGYEECVAVLTDKGREIAAREVEAAAVKLRSWPFPVSAHVDPA